eukprot:m.67209 g.67209  ORF g.67209 m.67209 type:complete len:375 (-) comp8210_c0_seq3:1535-2659(-)
MKQQGRPFSFFLVVVAVFTAAFITTPCEASTYAICSYSSLTATSGTIVSQYGSTYDNNMDCSLVYYVPIGYELTVDIVSFDLESCCDFLTLNSLTVTGVDSYYSTPGTVTFRFTSDSTIIGAGFAIDFSLDVAASIPDDQNIAVYVLCGGDYHTEQREGVVFSHSSYGRNDYGNNQDCSSVVDYDGLLDVYCDFVDLESGYDHLYIQSGSGSTEITSASEVDSLMGPLTFTFTTDSSVAGRGFRCMFRPSWIGGSWNALQVLASDAEPRSKSSSTTLIVVAVIASVIAVCIVFVWCKVTCKKPDTPATTSTTTSGTVLHTGYVCACVHVCVSVFLLLSLLKNPFLPFAFDLKSCVVLFPIQFGYYTNTSTYKGN